MKWRKFIRKVGKQGSYLVESAIIMPIFILAVLMFLSSIPAISVSENTVFSVSDELRYESAKAAFYGNRYIMMARMEGRLKSENPSNATFDVKACRYLYSKNHIDDLITVRYEQVYRGNDPFNLFDHVVFDRTITVRAFTGTMHQTAPAGSKVLNDEMVYVFPEWGMRYHDKNCTYVKGSCQMVFLTKTLKGDLQPCQLCNAKSAQIGSPIFYFSKYGQAYHLDSCRMVDRYYITVSKENAKLQGYSPCLKCGG